MYKPLRMLLIDRGKSKVDEELDGEEDWEEIESKS